MLYRNAICSLLSGALFFTAATAAIAGSGCEELTKPVTGEGQKYSMHANVNGPVAFADIGCAITYRNDRCAMEMVAFDTSAMVYDYVSGNKLAMAKAFYAIPDSQQNPAQVAAFADRGAAEQFITAQGNGRVVDYDELSLMKFK